MDWVREKKIMRERGAFGFLGIILLVTIVFFAIEGEQAVSTVSGAHSGGVPVIIINGRPLESNFIVQGDEGRVVIVVDQGDFFVGENTVEFRWGSAPLSTMTAELPAELQKH